MNDAGDMLRVSTNVAKQDGTCAIGTFIPATNPDGVKSGDFRGDARRGLYRPGLCGGRLVYYQL